MEQIIDSSDRPFLTLWSFKRFITLFMTVALNCRMMERGDAWQFGVFVTQSLTMLECLVNVSRCNELMMFHLMHFQRSKTFSECFEMILKRYWTFLSSVGERYQRVQMH